MYAYLTGKHIDVSSVGNGENVRWHLVTPFASIKFCASLGVYGESFVGVNSYTEEARVGLKIHEIERCEKGKFCGKGKNENKTFINSLIKI